jgi:3-phenylpropionate/cinnamic acid dioxygenase small subunit
MMSSRKLAMKSETPAQTRLPLADLQQFVEHEVELLDEQRFEEWMALFAEDGIYWVPAKRGQESALTHVSLFYDDKPTIGVRIRRLRHPAIHCQQPPSTTVRLVSNFRLQRHEPEPSLYRVTSKFIMIEDRFGAERRLFGGHYTHVLRGRADGGLEIVLKQVDLTNCDHTFRALTQPF